MQQHLIEAFKYSLYAGQWEYPSPTGPSQHTSDEMDLVASQELLTPPSSPSSCQSESSSTADRRDSANLDSMLDMISSQRHTHQTSRSQGPRSNTEQSHGGPLEPEQRSTTATAAASTAVESTEGSFTATGEAGIDTAESGNPQLQQIGDSSSAGDTDGNANNNSPPSHAPSEFALSPKDLAAREAALVAGAAEDDDACAGPHSSAAGPSSADSQLSEQASATAPAAVVDGDKPPQVSCSEQARTDDGKHGTTNGVGSASCQSSVSGKEQSQQSEPRNGTAEVDDKAPKTPIRKAPKKGGLVNVQRPAVKGYSIHR